MTPRLHNCNKTRRTGRAALRRGREVGRGVPPSRKRTKQLERKYENMKTELMMMVGTARRAVRNLALFAAVAVAFGAWADAETVGGYTWTYQISGGAAEVLV